MRFKSTIAAIAVMLMIALSSYPQQNKAAQDNDSLVAKAKAIHERAITIDTHVDISGANYATPELDPGKETRLKCDLVKMKQASNWQVISASSATPVAGNGTVNSNFVASLRGGTATNLFPLLRFGASGDTVPGLSINVTNGLASGVINSPTGGFYNVVIERFAGTNLVSQQYNLLVGD